MIKEVSSPPPTHTHTLTNGVAEKKTTFLN